MGASQNIVGTHDTQPSTVSPVGHIPEKNAREERVLLVRRGEATGHAHCRAALAREACIGAACRRGVLGALPFVQRGRYSGHSVDSVSRCLIEHNQQARK